MDNSEQESLARVGPGTPSGEVFRRYWLPVETSANLGGGRGQFLGTRNPLRLRVLGENLVLFRDGAGKPGLVAEHCAHWGTSLFYGRVEENCIRCLYHGWAFDRDGTCIDQPAEPPTSNFKATVRQPACPCVELGGLIFAYMGPSDQKPPFPRYPQLFRRDGLRVTGKRGRIQKSNVFLQILDNVLDPWHTQIAHGWFKGTPVVERMHHGLDGQQATPVKYERTPWGARYAVLRNTEQPGRYEYHETHAVFPCQRSGQQGASSMNWAVPIDDFSTRWFGLSFIPFDKDGNIPAEAYRRLNNVSPEDEVIMGTQGDAERGFLPDWEQWHLASSERGVALMHRLWKEQVDRVKEGLDPIGVIREPDDDRLVPLTGEMCYLTWDEGLRLFSMSSEQRIEMVESDLASLGAT